MTYKRAVPILIAIPTVESKDLVQPEKDSTHNINITKTCKKVVHTVRYDYCGIDDFSKFLLSAAPIIREILDLGDLFEGDEEILFLLICTNKWQKQDESDPNSYWYCNLIYARNFYNLIFTGFDNIFMNIFMNPNRRKKIMELDRIERVCRILSNKIPEFKNWKTCGENIPI